jgi:peptidyl-dipeptidase A
VGWWNASVTGRDENFKAEEEAQNRRDAAPADPPRFARLKAIHPKPIPDATAARGIAVLHLQYQEKQVDPGLLRQITAKANTVEKAEGFAMLF